MNYLLFDENDLDESGRLQVNGRRAEHLLTVLRVQPGQTVRVGKINGNLGEATVREISDSRVSLDLQELTRVVPRELSVTLVLATPRPQSLKKVLQSAAAIGVSRVMLISAARVEKAYYSSPVLRPDRMNEELKLGLEQAGATQLPSVEVLQMCKPGGRGTSGEADRRVFESAVESSTIRLLPHPGAECRLPDLFPAEPAKRDVEVMLAIGPEGGWIESEIQAFKDLGFQAFCLGHRVLRVETAVDVLLGQLQLLRAMDRV